MSATSREASVEFSRALSLVDKTPPDNANDWNLAEFYLDRGRAAHNVGRTQQEVDDYRLAVEYAEASGSKLLDRAQWAYGRAIVRTRHWSDGIAVMEQSIENNERPFSRSLRYAVIAWQLADAGDLTEAGENVRKRASRAPEGRCEATPAEVSETARVGVPADCRGGRSGTRRGGSRKRSRSTASSSKPSSTPTRTCRSARVTRKSVGSP